MTAFHGDEVNLTAHVRSHFTLGGPRPGGGTVSVPFGDEFNAGVRVHFVHSTRPFRSYDYYGYAVGAEYREWIGVRMATVSVSWAFPSRTLFRNWLSGWFGIG